MKLSTYFLKRITLALVSLSMFSAPSFADENLEKPIGDVIGQILDGSQPSPDQIYNMDHDRYRDRDGGRGGYPDRYRDRDGGRGGYPDRYRDRDGGRGGFPGRHRDRDGGRGGYYPPRYPDRDNGRGGYPGRHRDRDDGRGGYYPPRYQTWTCVANDSGFEEHYGGHIGYGRSQYEAAQNASSLCLRSHGNCYVSSCQIQ